MLRQLQTWLWALERFARIKLLGQCFVSVCVRSTVVPPTDDPDRVRHYPLVLEPFAARLSPGDAYAFRAVVPHDIIPGRVIVTTDPPKDTGCMVVGIEPDTAGVWPAGTEVVVTMRRAARSERS